MIVASVLLALVGFASCASDDPDPVSRSVSFEFVNEVAEGDNRSRTVEDSGTAVQYGMVTFTGAGNLAEDAVNIELQAYVHYRDGVGPAGGFLTATTADGDQLVFELDLATTLVGDGAQVGGGFRVIAGTGKFEDVTGGGTGVGVRGKTLGTGVSWTADLTLTGLED